MKRSDWIWGIGIGLLVGVVGFGLRGAGVSWPLEGLFAQITYWLGVPAMFNLIHKLLGYGEAGKNLAFAGTVVGWLLVHPFLWLALRRWFWVGLVLSAGFYWLFGGFVLLNLEAGLLSALQNSVPGIWSALIYGGAVGILAWWLNRRSMAPALANPTSQSRRETMKTLGVLAVGALLWQQAKAQGGIIWSKITGLSKEQFNQKDLYVVSKNVSILDPKLKGKPWKLEVGGSVKTPTSFSLDDIKALPSVELLNTMTCISNPVGGDLIGAIRWKGTPLKNVLDKAGVKGEAKHIIWEAADRFMETIPLSEIPAEALLAYAVQNPETGQFEDLEEQHGYPLRILLPGRYGMKQPKWLTKITLATNEITGYWAQRGWSRTAVIRTMSRIDVPKSRTKIKAGEETFIAGITYAGGRALERVEVSSDGGKTWQKADLKAPKGKFAWAQWALSWKPAAGNYSLQVRAVEVGEKTQDASLAEPLPDGASGYHTVNVKVG